MTGLTRRDMWLALVLSGVAGLTTVARADEGVGATLCILEKPELHVCYREVPWSPDRVGRTETGDTRPLTPWTVATMDVRRPLGIGRIELEPGCYAWFCVADKMGHPVLQLRRLRLPRGTLPDPETVPPHDSQTLFELPIQFDTSRGISPHLTIELSLGKKGLRVKTRYGDGEAETTLLKR